MLAPLLVDAQVRVTDVPDSTYASDGLTLMLGVCGVTGKDKAKIHTCYLLELKRCNQCIHQLPFNHSFEVPQSQFNQRNALLTASQSCSQTYYY